MFFFILNRRGTGFFATLKIADTEHHVIVTNNHVINNKEDAANAVARFHYEGNLPGADARLMPDVLFYTEEVRFQRSLVTCQKFQSLFTN